MRYQSWKKIALRVFIGIYFALGIYTQLGLMEILPIQKSFLQDFSIYERAAKDVAIGKDPYSEKRIGVAYLYPPQSLLVFEAFGRIEEPVVKACLFMLVNIVMLIYMTHGIIKHYNLTFSDAWFLYWLALGFAPFLELLYLGQVNEFVEFGLFLAFVYAVSMPWLAGVGLGWAIMLKITPIVFLAYLFICKRWKAIAATLGTILFFTLLAWMRYGTLPFRSYTGAFHSMVGQFPNGLESHSLFSVIDRFVDVGKYAPAAQIGLNVYLLLILATGVLGYYIHDADLFFATLGIAVTLTPNLLWYHHHIFLLLPLFILICRSRLHLLVTAWCLLGFIIIQIDRFYLTAGLLIHIFGHLTIMALIVYQIHLARVRYLNQQASTVLPTQVPR